MAQSNNNNKIVLDDVQKFALMKFRRSVHDILQPQHDDRFLLRWLRARSWDPEAAEKMLRTSFYYRAQWGIDTTLKSWEPPEILQKYFPHGVTGYDKEGAPVIVVPFAGFDVYGILHSASKQDVIKLMAKYLETYLEMANESGAYKLTVVFDLDKFNLKQYAWRPAAELVVGLLQMYEANYPEILKDCYLINAPRIFAVAFNVVKRFLNEYTLGKIQIFKSDPKKWKPILLENIGANSLPKYFGGNLQDPDGNPRYITVVKPGGKVPRSYYTKNLHDETLAKSTEYKTAVIKKGDKLTLDFIVAEEGCVLRWDFRTEGHDIRFGISVKDIEGTVNPVVRHKRIAAHQINETGVISCQAPATYTVTFDNSYSILRSKKIHYNIFVSDPLAPIEIPPPDDEEEGRESVETGTEAANIAVPQNKLALSVS